MGRADWIIYGAIIAMAAIGVALLAGMGEWLHAAVVASACTVLSATHAAAMVTRKHEAEADQ